MKQPDKIGFEHGHLTIFAQAAGITKQQLANCLRGYRNMKPRYAEAIQAKAEELGYETSIFDWLHPLDTMNPLFAKWHRG